MGQKTTSGNKGCLVSKCYTSHLCNVTYDVFLMTLALNAKKWGSVLPYTVRLLMKKEWCFIKKEVTLITKNAIGYYGKTLVFFLDILKSTPRWKIK